MPHTFTLDDCDVVDLLNGVTHYWDSTDCPMARAIKRGLAGTRHVFALVAMTGALIDGKVYALDVRGHEIDNCLSGRVCPVNTQFTLIGFKRRST